MMYKPEMPHVFTLYLTHEQYVSGAKLEPVDLTVRVGLRTLSGVLTYSQVDSLLNVVREHMMQNAIPDKLAEMLAVGND